MAYKEKAILFCLISSEFVIKTCYCFCLLPSVDADADKLSQFQYVHLNIINIQVINVELI